MTIKDYPKKLTLKDGTAVVIRPMVKEDGDALFSFFKGLPEEDRLFLRDDITDKAVINRFVSDIDYSKVLPLLAFEGDKVVGDATLRRSHFGWKTHVGEIRLVVARKFQQKGLGSTLAKLLVEFAMSSGLDILTAEIIENQIGAAKALGKLGFKKEAVLKGRVKDIHGTRRNLVLLANDISHIWHAMESVYLEYMPSQE